MVEKIRTSADNVAQGTRQRGKDPAWWADCRKRKNAGESVRSLCERFGKSRKTINTICGPQESLDEQRGRRPSIAFVTTRKNARGERKHVIYGEQHVPRQVARIIPPATAIMDLARRFAAGEISRDELSYHLRGGANG